MSDAAKADLIAHIKELRILLAPTKEGVIFAVSLSDLLDMVAKM